MLHLIYLKVMTIKQPTCNPVLQHRQNNPRPPGKCSRVFPMLLPYGRTAFKPQKGVPDQREGLPFCAGNPALSANRQRLAAKIF